MTVTVQFMCVGLCVSGAYTPPVKECHTTKGGDPGWPAEPAQFEVERITTDAGDDVTDLILCAYGCEPTPEIVDGTRTYRKKYVPYTDRLIELVIAAIQEGQCS